MIEEHGIVNERMETEVAGVFAASDVRANFARRAPLSRRQPQSVHSPLLYSAG